MYYKRGSLTFEVLEFGKATDPLIILLHGFPASAASWRPTAERLASSGYYVLVPEQRGYSKNARPRRRKDYRLSELVEDIVALLSTAGVATVHIVGHDWGGVVAWAFASKYPEKTRSLTAISTPHPKALISSLIRSKQVFLSWYMLFLQFPWLPEWVVSAQGGKKLHKMLVSSGLKEDVAAIYTLNMLDRNRLKGALNWYRALPFTLLEVRALKPVQVSTLFMYGDKDIFLSKKAAVATRGWVKGGYKYLDLPAATHWIPEESPVWLADEITEYI